MKNIRILFAILLLIIAHESSAQTEKYMTAMKNGIARLKTVRTHDDFINSANYFERMASAEPSQWHPSYYASYCRLLAALTGKKENMDTLLDLALEQIQSADQLSADNSEIYALRGYIQFMKMSVDPRARMAYMQSAAAMLDKAITLNPENPRPYYIKGQNLFYTPAVFGGGKQVAKALLEKAATKFANFKATAELDPEWGNQRNSELLELCNKE